MQSIIIKRLIVLLFLFLAFNFAKAQSWDPMANNHRCNYGFSSNEPTVTLWNDSIFGIGNFSVHYIKKVCRQIDKDSFKNHYLLINQPTFLLSQYSIDLKKIVFSDPTTKASYKLLLRGTQTFLFDSINNITVQKVTNGKLKVLGEIEDSVKVYQLSNADTIILSKGHGMIKFPSFQDHKHYKLLGLENLAGIQIPKFHNFFDFNIGDAFEYTITEEHISYPRFLNTTIRKLTILNKRVKGDSLIYTCDVKQRKIKVDYIYLTNDSIYTQKTDSLIFINYPNSFINKYPGEIMPITEQLINPVNLYYDNDYQSLVKSFEGSEGYPYQKNGTDTLKYIPYFTDPNKPDIYLEDVDPTAVIMPKWYHSKTFKYAVGLGMIEKISHTSPSGPQIFLYKLKLTAAKTSERQYGKFTEESILTGTSNIASASELLIYPNPAKSYLMIENKQGNKEMIVSILSTDGKELMRQTSKGEKAKLDIQHLKSGIYFIKIEQDKSVEVRKIIKE